MKRILPALALLLGALSAHAERVIVQPVADLPPTDLTQIVRSVGGRHSRIGGSDLYIVEVSNAKAAAALLAHHPSLRLAEADTLHAPALTPNDPYFSSEWHLAKIGAPTAWDTAQGAGVVVAVLDTGVDASHPDLAGKLVAGWNVYANTSNTTDTLGHGTAVAGTVGALTGNAIGVSSVAPGVSIMPIVVSSPAGYATGSAIASGIVYAADHGARLANVSFEGIPGNTTIISAANYMKGKGGLVFVAAGNTGTLNTAADSTAFIPVSATLSDDSFASWSSYGAFVHLSAPGSPIWTTQMGGGYWQVWGTSFSSPIAAGAAALVMTANPALANVDVEQVLYLSATDLGAAGRDQYFGYGRVSAAAAVQLALTYVPTPPPPPPPPTKPGKGHK